MQALKEDIKIFQDPKNNRLTIVCYNLTAQTKHKLVDTLLGDISAVETVEDVEVPAPDMSPEIQDTDQMEPVNPKLTGTALVTEITKLAGRYVNEPSAQIIQQIKNMITTSYDEDENTLRGILYSMRNLSQRIINLFVEQMGYGSVSEAPTEERDAKIIEALSAASKETLITTLRALNGE